MLVAPVLRTASLVGARLILVAPINTGLPTTLLWCGPLHLLHSPTVSSRSGEQQTAGTQMVARCRLVVFPQLPGHLIFSQPINTQATVGGTWSLTAPSTVVATT